MHYRCFSRFFLGSIINLFVVSLTWAADPKLGQFNFPFAANDLATMLVSFHNLYLLPVCFGISAFVLLLLIYTCWRYSEKRNPEPSVITHNTLIEVAWTIIPILILGVIFLPSMRILYASDKALDYAFTVKIIGNQWYWGYEYPDHGGISFNSYMIQDDELNSEQKRLMDVDNPLVIPVDTPILLQFTSNDVIHNWSIAEFAIRMDTIPGQLNEAPLYPIKKIGTYYGFCSELCGAGHSFMPIAVKVVSKKEFDIWIKKNSQKLAYIKSYL